MKRILFVLITLAVPIYVFCQNDTCKISEYKGVLCKTTMVFSAGCSVPEIDKFINLKRVTPTIEEAERCDKIIDQFKQIFTAKFCKRNRELIVYGQLIGYSDGGSGTIFIQQLIFLSPNENIEKIIPSFYQRYVVGFGSVYEKKTIILRINIENKTISIL